MKKDLLLLYMPTPDQRMLPVPPLGISLLAGHLAGQGRSVVLDDLEAKSWERDVVEKPLLKRLVRQRLPLRYNNPKKVLLDIRKIHEYLLCPEKQPAIDRLMRQFASLLGRPPEGFSFVGFSVMSMSQLAASLCFARYLKQKYDARIVLGGSFITRKMGALLERYDFLDYLVIGEGEVPLSRLLAGEQEETIDNLVFRRSGSVIANKTVSQYVTTGAISLEGLPLECYRKTGIPVFLYETSKGCKNTCAFCITRRKQYFVKSAESAVEEIRRIISVYPTRFFFFVDNAINMDRRFCVDFCTRLIKDKVGIRWSAYCIPEKMDGAYLRLLKDAGCVQLRWGVEIFGDEVTKAMNKYVDRQAAFEAVRQAHRLGIWNHLLFLVGHPGEKFRDIAQLVSFIKQCRGYFKSAVVSSFDFDRVDMLDEPDGQYGGAYANGRFYARECYGIGYRVFTDRYLWLKHRLVIAALKLYGIRFLSNFNPVKDDFRNNQFMFRAFHECDA